MNVKNEIERYSVPSDVPVLLWLLERYHYQSQWGFVAKSTFQRGEYFMQGTRTWTPTAEGRVLYAAAHAEGSKS